jgi:hypothetical protein
MAGYYAALRGPAYAGMTSKHPKKRLICIVFSLRDLCDLREKYSLLFFGRRSGAVVAENRSCRLVGAIHASGTSVTLRVCCPHIESLFPLQEPRLKTLPVIRMKIK